MPILQPSTSLQERRPQLCISLHYKYLINIDVLMLTSKAGIIGVFLIDFLAMKCGLSQHAISWPHYCC